MQNDDVRRVQRAVATAMEGLESASIRLLLAVSGGLDSMCLLDAAAMVLPRMQLLVATFDHSTGAAACAAQQLVIDRARSLGLEVIADRSSIALATEAEWRDARWRFLRQASAASGAVVATAHTRDDAIETVLMRVLRDAGARGLAALSASSDVLRPFIEISRAQLERYAAARGVAWIEDPSNASRAFLRNRLRRDVLPALRRARPSIDEELLEIAKRAAEWRVEVEATVDRAVQFRVRGTPDDPVGVDVVRADLAGYSPTALAILWPALLARAGVVMDRRGTRRLAEFTTTGRVGSRIQLSGGWEVGCTRDRLEVRSSAAPTAESLAFEPMVWERHWRFVEDRSDAEGDAWSASLPEDRPLRVRRWLPGDALTASTGRSRRKVKHLLSKARIGGHVRARWPVVLAGDEIVWIPGVSRSDAATVRSGRPGLTYRCDFHDG